MKISSFGSTFQAFKRFDNGRRSRDLLNKINIKSRKEKLNERFNLNRGILQYEQTIDCSLAFKNVINASNSVLDIYSINDSIAK